jgi:hypothetical protein
MKEPHRNPIVWCLMGYLAITFALINIGFLTRIRWIQFLGGAMLALVAMAAILAAILVAFDFVRSRRRRGM